MSEQMYFNSLAEFEEAVSGGEKPVVSPKSPRDVLIRAAELGLELGDIDVDHLMLWTANHEFVWLDREWVERENAKGEWTYESAAFGTMTFLPSGDWRRSGYGYVAETLDFELIEAWLKAGHAAEMDATKAVQKGCDSVLSLFDEYGVAADMKTIFDGSSYLSDDGVVTIPEGVAMIMPGAFGAECLGDRVFRELHLPESLEIIASDAFTACSGIKEVRLPKGVKLVGMGALPYCRTSTVFFDSVDERCVSCLIQHPSRGSYSEWTIVSSLSGEVKFKHWAGGEEMSHSLLQNYRWRKTWAPSWGFDFSLDDEGYSSMKPKGKAITALNRLTWPIDLDAKTEKKYRTYLKNNPSAAFDFICERDDAQRLDTLVESGAFGVEEISQAIAHAEAVGAGAVLASLRQLSASRPDEEPKQKLTPAKAFEKAKRALEEGGSDCVELLKPVAMKVGDVAKVELLEAAAACSTAEQIESLYDLFGSFEYSSNALALSIMAGKADNAKVLIEHGASFEEVPDPEIIAAEFDEKKKKRFAQYLKFAYEDFRKRSKDSAVLTLEKSNYSGAQYKYLLPGYRDRNVPCTGEPSPQYPRANSEAFASVVVALAEGNVIDKDWASAFGLLAFSMGHYPETRMIASVVGGKLSSTMVPSSMRSSRYENKCNSIPSDYVSVFSSNPEIIRCLIDIEDPSNISAELSSWSEAQADVCFGRNEMNEEVSLLIVPFVDSNMGIAPAMARASAKNGWKETLDYLLALDGLATSDLVKSCIAAAQESGNTEMVACLLERVAEMPEGSLSGLEDIESSEESCEISFADLAVGDRVFFGRYPQRAGFGPEPIEWVAVSDDDETALLLSVNILEILPFHESDEDVTWEGSSLRSWLNEDFYSKAFTERERDVICVSQINNIGTHNSRAVLPESIVEDRLFLLSVDEVKALFKRKDARIAKVTQLAMNRYGDALDGDGEDWFLRSPGNNGFGCGNVAFVDSAGSIDKIGYVSYEEVGIRPALRVFK